METSAAACCPGLSGAVFTGLRGGMFWLAGNRVVSRLRLAMFRAMLRQDVGFFDVTPKGVLSSRLSSDATRVADVVSFNLNILARQFIQALGGTAYLFKLDGRLAALSLAFMGLAAGLTDVYGRASRRLAKDTMDALAASAAYADEALQNVRVRAAQGCFKCTSTLECLSQITRVSQEPRIHSLRETLKRGDHPESGDPQDSIHLSS